MTISRIPFDSRFASTETLAVCVTVAGVPLVLCPAGLAPTATAVTSGSVDPAWWPGAGALTYDLPALSGISPVRAWLDPGTVWEVFRAVDPLKGDAKVESLTFDVYDPAGAATAVLSGQRARTTALLTSTVTSAATSIPLDSTSGIASSGVAWIGREAVIYDGVGGGALTLTSSPATRGAFGSRARGHRFDSTQPAVVSFGAWPRFLYGRLATVWLCRVSGTTLYDPTAIYQGTIGPGVQRSASGTRWQIPIDNVVEVLSRKIAPRTFTLYGIAHLDTTSGLRAPLAAGVVGTFLGSTSSATDDHGWHPDAASFIDDWNAAAGSVFADSVVASLVARKVSARVSGVGAGAHTLVRASWDTTPDVDLTADGSGVALWVSRRAMPDTVLHLDGKVPFPAPGDLAKIPAALFYTTPGATAGFFLSVGRGEGDPLTAIISATGTNGTLDYADVAAPSIAGESDADRQVRTLITERSTATLGVYSDGETAAALVAAALALDALDGGLHEDVIDWTAVASAFASIPLGSLPSARRYLFGDDDTLMLALSHEARLRGMAMCSRWGRLSVYRTAVFASTEETVATIAETDILCDDNGAPIEPEVIDSPGPVATSMTFSLPGGTSYQWVDDTSRGEFGDGAEVTCKALEWTLPGTDLSGVVSSLQAVAQQLLGVLAEPYRVVRVTLGPRFLGLQEGDLVLFTHPRVPTYVGTLGVSAATCQVQEVRLQVMGGKGRVSVALRLQDADLAGYAPEALVAAGGLDHASTVVTVDTASAWGVTCFSRELRPDGSTATSAIDGFAVGQKVRLSQIGTRTPISDESFAVTAVDAVAGTITLDNVPSLAMAAAAASQYGVLIRFAAWPTIDAASAPVRDDQERYLYIADHTAGDLGSGDAPKRWAA